MVNLEEYQYYPAHLLCQAMKGMEFLLKMKYLLSAAIPASHSADSSLLLLLDSSREFHVN